tara:strand:+ start:249 stop:467 length:219 start_codon:yes stop_codon:yes gene_type:complete
MCGAGASADNIIAAHARQWIRISARMEVYMSMQRRSANQRVSRQAGCDARDGVGITNGHWRVQRLGYPGDVT